MNYPYLKNHETDIEKVIIETSRCRIESFRTEGIDFEDLSHAFCEANEKLYVSPFQPNPIEERDFIEKAIEKRKNGEALECFVFDKTTNRIVGSIGLTSINTTEPNLGLWIRKELHGRGYGTELYTNVIDWIKQETDLILLKHTANPENTASIRLAERFGGKLQKELTESGSLKYYIYLN